ESVGTQWRYVDYSDVRMIHVDDLVTARVDQQSREKVYAVALLSKSRRWQSFDWEAEQEIRFVSKAQNVNMVIDGSISRVILGSALDDSAVRRGQVIAGSIPVEHGGMY
ncbi:MAG: hypothetical protein ABMA15_26305, partial [Vicinamibacterales bacterium]